MTNIAVRVIVLRYFDKEVDEYMKIVVLDGYTENPGDLSWAGMEAFGEVTVYDRVSYVDSPVIAEKLGDAEVAVVNKTPITKATMDACPNLKAVAVLATGYNVVDTAYAKEKGIVVMNVPTYGTQIVGQYAVGLLLEICAHYGHHDRTVKEGRWQNNIDWCYWDYPMIELAGKTVGVIGLGRIGQTSAKILGALGMRVIAYDSFQSEAGICGSRHAACAVGCDLPSLPALPVHRGNDQQGQHCEDERWCDPHQQQPRPARSRAGSG